MSTMRDHLKKAHTEFAEHAIAQAKFHKAMASHYGQLAEMCKGAKSEMHDGGTYQSVCEAMGESHGEMADTCANHAAFHVDAAKECAKTADTEFEKSDRLRPSSVSLIVPESTENRRAVLRTGQRAIEGAEVPSVLQKIVATVEED